MLNSKLLSCDLHFGARFSSSHSLFLAYLLATAREGHLCVELDQGKLFPSWGAEDAKLIELALSCPAELSCVVRRQNRWYLRRHAEIEDKFLYHLQRLEQAQVPALDLQLPPQLNVEQQEVLRTALSGCPVTWVSGGPGTGKTFTAACLIEAFPSSVMVAAPTGKAAANLRRALNGIEVQTLHSLLAQHRIFSADLIVIDEGSMVDASTFSEFFSRIRTGARVVIFGDEHQLPPVSSGHFFADCSSTQAIRLQTSLRTDKQEIIDLAQAVKLGQTVSYLELPSPHELVRQVSWGKTTVLTPLRQGPYGVDQLNRHLAKLLRSEAVPIMLTQNVPSLELYNGDVGYLEADKAYFGQRVLSRGQLPSFELAHVLSVHKSQGSEYEHVTILLPEGSEVFGRSMLYTAITRARKKVTIYATKSVLEGVLAKSQKRRSVLPSSFIHRGF
ncbi:MAG: AAA family ATPase [Verrucomicrobia bacterium]|nr:AAA family ATPase [Verrucomicrobiota bacterium]MBS0646159.1 AAA family ATPase [Verrucomicrobiota bacterium]